MVGLTGSRRVIALLTRTLREGFQEKVAFEQRPEGGEGVCCEVSWGVGIRREGTESAKVLRLGDT